ncbi:EF-hand domain-containing protein [Actinomadura harenae]|uniref:Calcium-binding protein n=1 Tax=Actinomadura harenae TaxID=2483351 RepID=A0A3M2LU82_9ACTN|nr:EF-hand domain-containing protein [Actinomadura harenae]RMI40666.1 calcium-binding protein [Actinomadura harenae]
MSDLRTRKYHQWFQGADVDRDGVLTRDDLMRIAERAAAAQGIAPNSPHARQLNESMDWFWTDIIAPHDSDGDERVDRAEMTQGFLISLNDRSRYPEQIKWIADLVFDLGDTDGDGKISLDEFTQVFGAGMQVPTADCTHVFNRLDLDESGTLPRLGYHDAVIEFFYGDDPKAAANHLFGRI